MLQNAKVGNDNTKPTLGFEPAVAAVVVVAVAGARCQVCLVLCRSECRACRGKGQKRNHYIPRRSQLYYHLTRSPWSPLGWRHPRR